MTTTYTARNAALSLADARDILATPERGWTPSQVARARAVVAASAGRVRWVLMTFPQAGASAMAFTMSPKGAISDMRPVPIERSTRMTAGMAKQVARDFNRTVDGIDTLMVKPVTLDTAHKWLDECQRRQLAALERKGAAS